MQAVVYTGPLTIEVQDIPEPAAAPGEVVVDVRAVGICGSELEGFASQSPFRVPPLVMGHEFAGVRTDTGDHVAVNPLVACGVCDICARGLANVCRHRQIIGIQRPGGYAERVAVPAVNCHVAQAGVPFTALALAEPLANGVHALGLVQRHDPWPQRVGIIGGGAIGLGQALLAKGRGIPEVELCDLSPDRLDAARRAGIAVREGELAEASTTWSSTLWARPVRAARAPGWCGRAGQRCGLACMVMTPTSTDEG